jgi:hypothetical protein
LLSAAPLGAAFAFAPLSLNRKPKFKLCRRNLLTYVALSVLTVWMLRCLVGGVLVRGGICQGFMRIGLTPLFCG